MKSDAEIWAFWGAITQGDIATAQEYLNSGGGVDDTSGGYTALYRTIHMRHQEGYLEWLKFLLDAGADPNHSQGGADSQLVPLSLAVGHNILGAAELLLKYGADPNIFQATCLHISAINPHVEMLQLLLDHGADYSIKDDEGKCPINTLQEAWDYRSQTMPGFAGFENEATIRQMISPDKMKHLIRRNTTL